jgi:OmpA family protein
MKKLTWSCFVAAFLAGSSAVSYAQDKNVLEGAYVGIGAGATRAKFTEDDFTSNNPGISESKDSTDKGYKLTFGFKVDRHWAFELGRTNFGKFSHTYDGGAAGSVVQNYKVSGWWGSVLGMIPIGNRFTLFGRLGQIKSSASTESEKASGTITDTLAAAGVPTNGEKTKISTILGVGAQIDFPGQLGLRVEVEDYGTAGDSDNTGRARMRMASASLMYRF